MRMAQPRTFLHRIGKGLQPGSLSQKQIDLLEKPSSGGFVLQKEVIPPGTAATPTTRTGCPLRVALCLEGLSAAVSKDSGARALPPRLAEKPHEYVTRRQ